MRLQNIDSSLLRSYGEHGRSPDSISGNQAPEAKSVRVVSDAVVGDAENERKQDSQAVFDRQELEQAAQRMQERLKEQGVQLEFDVINSDGQIVVEVTDPERDKVLMRLPAKSVLDVDEQGKMTLGALLNKHS